MSETKWDVSSADVAQVKVIRARESAPLIVEDDVVAVEEPLEIRVAGRRLAVTMRTPGNDEELAVGFLLSEGIISAAEDVVAVLRPDATSVDRDNIVDVALAGHVPPVAESMERNVLTTSACGLCGRTSIDSVRTKSCHPQPIEDRFVGEKVLHSLPVQLRAAQNMFEKTGGIHAAALFTLEGEMLALREDVGRHNAVDKVIGWALHEQLLPLGDQVLMVSGRSSFELTQKAIMAGIPMLASVSAPSSLAVDLARESGLTLIGFLRGESFVIYSGESRITRENSH